MLQQLGLFDRLADRFNRQFDVWDGSSSIDLRFLQHACAHEPKIFAEQANALGLRGADRQAIVAYLLGHGGRRPRRKSAVTADEPVSRLWDSNMQPRWMQQ
eukprot:scaffold22853_cov142-Isochrysis_galbana.AAC.1